MEQRTLKRTGLTVSRVCLGTMTFAAQTDEAAAASMVDCCLGVRGGFEGRGGVDPSRETA